MLRLAEAILQRLDLLVAQSQASLHRKGMEVHFLEGFQIAHAQKALLRGSVLFVLFADTQGQFAEIGIADRHILAYETNPAANGANISLVSALLSGGRSRRIGLRCRVCDLL